MESWYIEAEDSGSDTVPSAMKFRSCEMRRAEDSSIGALFKAPEGSFSWGWAIEKDQSKIRELRVVMPYTGDGFHSLHMLRVVKSTFDGERWKCVESPPENKPWWHWNCDLENPTLAPSIACGDNGNLWHGYIRSGRIEACE